MIEMEFPATILNGAIDGTRHAEGRFGGIE